MSTERRTIPLVGFMGAGKSTAGDRLARREGMPFVDLDRRIEAEFGRTVPEIFETQGEPAFRAAEKRALREVLAGPPVVLATGGGVVEDAENRALLRETGRVIWLDVPFETVRERLQGEEGERRPLLVRLGWVGLQRLHQRRRALYASCARFRFDAERDGPGPLVRRIAVALGPEPERGP